MKKPFIFLVLATGLPFAHTQAYAQNATTPVSLQSQANTPTNTTIITPGYPPASTPPFMTTNQIVDYAQKNQNAESGSSAVAGSVPPLPPSGLPGVPRSEGAQNKSPEEPVAKPPLDSEVDQEAEARALWEFDPSQNIRQSGQRIEQPTHHGFFYSASGQDQELLGRWITLLVNEGIREEKIVFEAKRLSKQDFQRWASKIVWWEKGLHPNIARPQY